MTWYIETGKFPVVGSVIRTFVFEKDQKLRVPDPLPIGQRLPFTAEQKSKLPPHVEGVPREHGFVDHLLVSSDYLFLSQSALDVLRTFQNEGWEAFEFPVKVAKETSKAARDALTGDHYWMVNLHCHRDVLDGANSTLKSKVWHKGSPLERTVYSLADGDQDGHRTVVVKKGAMGDVALCHDLGADPEGFITKHIFFVSDPLKEAWCKIGMNPVLFEPCIEV